MKIANLALSSLLVLSAAGCAPTLNAWYPFTLNAKDASGNGLDGTVTNAALTTDAAGNWHQAYAFNGKAQIALPASPKLSLSSFTIAFQIEPTKRPDTTVLVLPYTCADMAVVTKAAASGTGYFGNYSISYSACGGSTYGYICYVHDTAGGNYSACDWSAQLPFGRWYKIAISYSAGTLKFYRNGVLTTTLTTVPPPVLNTASPLIGAYPRPASPSTGVDFVGSLDDVRFYDGALGDAQIAAL